MVNPRIIGFAMTVLLFIGVVAALGGPVVGDADANVDDIIPSNGMFATASFEIPGVEVTVDVPTPTPLIETVQNLLDIYNTILQNGGTVTKFVVVLMLFLISYEFGMAVLSVIKDVIPLT